LFPEGNVSHRKRKGEAHRNRTGAKLFHLAGVLGKTRSVEEKLDRGKNKVRGKERGLLKKEAMTGRGKEAKGSDKTMGGEGGVSFYEGQVNQKGGPKEKR